MRIVRGFLLLLWTPRVVADLLTGEIAVEAFTCLLVFKNMFSFVLTFYAYEWFAHGGVKHTMIVIASIQAGICVLTIPMCKSSGVFVCIWCWTDLCSADIFGKWNRLFLARYNILEVLHLW